MHTLRTNPHQHGIPRLQRLTIEPVKGQQWHVTCPDEYANLLRQHPEAFAPFCKISTPSARLLDVQTVPVHCAMRPSDHEIFIASPNGNREIFLLDQPGQDAAFSQLVSAEPAWRNAMTALRTHMETIATIGEQATSRWHEITERYDLPRVDGPEWDEVYALADQKAAQLREHAARYKPPMFERVTNFLLGLTAEYPLLRVHLLKLVMVLPSLGFDTNGTQIKRLTCEAFRRMRADNSWVPDRRLPWWFHFSAPIVHGLLAVLPARWVKTVIHKSVGLVAERFIAGETVAEATEYLKKFYQSGRDVTLDILGELATSSETADTYHRDVMDAFEGFSQIMTPGKRNPAGKLRAEVSIKLSAHTHDFNPNDPEGTYVRVKDKLIAEMRAAKTNQVHLNMDAEHYAYRDLCFYCYGRALRETPELRDWKDVSIVVQAYLQDAVPHLRAVMALARECGVRMGIRLAKGAYWDGETVEAAAHNFPAPQYLNKEETDLQTRQMIVETLRHGNALQLAFASHNAQDHAFAEAVRETMLHDAPPIEHQGLHGTDEPGSQALTAASHPNRHYIVIGNRIAGMGYLTRRINENASQAGVLNATRMNRRANIPHPHVVHQRNIAAGTLRRDPTTKLTGEFRNITPVRLYRAAEREPTKLAMADAIANAGALRSTTGLSGPIVEIVSPSDPTMVVGRIATATAADPTKPADFAQTADATDTAAAIRRATTAARGEWPTLPPTVRAAVGLSAAVRLTVDRLKLASEFMLEGGKSMPESLPDIDEAIDFLGFYARDAAATTNRPRGVTAAIAPWNFMAIPVGMAAAPALAGNAVLLKPADHTPLIAHAVLQHLYAAGMPHDVLQLLPGDGATVGASLVHSADIATLVFTGSRDVGVDYIAGPAVGTLRNVPAQPGIQVPAVVITEMGGKNFDLVTATADLDVAVVGGRDGAFGHTGQKCSATSRKIVAQEIANEFARRFTAAARDLRVGPAWDLATHMNPVISAEEKIRIQKDAKAACAEAVKYGGTVLLDRSQEDLPGNCVGPCVILLPASRARHPDSYAQRELFGPIVHIIVYDTLDEGIAIANGVPYNLTGAGFAQSQDDLERVLAETFAAVGYGNRSGTGARVDIEPFGADPRPGKFSGTGPKAGGHEYVPAFTLPSDTAPTPTYRPTFSNRRIPGQLSYTDQRDIRRCGYVVQTDTTHPRTAQHLAIAAQVGCTVHTARQLSAQEIFKAEFIIIDGDAAAVATMQQQMWTTLKGQTMPKFITPFDHVQASHFVYQRTRAVNVMQHGAVLEVETPS